jgi:hypothetical protein
MRMAIVPDVKRPPPSGLCRENCDISPLVNMTVVVTLKPLTEVLSDLPISVPELA